MIIEKIEIKNFDYFEEIDITLDVNSPKPSKKEEKNIHIFELEFGMGICPFSKLIKWCLSGSLPTFKENNIQYEHYPDYIITRRDKESKCYVELSTNKGEILRRQLKQKGRPKKYLPKYITDFMFVSGENIASLVFMQTGGNEELFDILFKDPRKRKINEKTLNEYLNKVDDHYCYERPQVKINYQRGMIEGINGWNRGAGSVLVYQIFLHAALYTILNKEEEFPIFFTNIFMKIDTYGRSILVEALPLYNGQLFFIASRNELYLNPLKKMSTNHLKFKWNTKKL